MGKNRYRSLFLFIGSCLVLGLGTRANPANAWAGSAPGANAFTVPGVNTLAPANFVKGKLDTATFAMGCFWCTQAQFQLLKGVKKVVAGYTGGQAVNPSYRQVASGTTGHAEACNIVYDPTQITYDELLAAFFTAHDPTQLNRQGNDVGTQYRSAIFFRNATQKKKAEYYIGKLNDEKAYKKPIVTTVTPFTVFYMAEADEQDFYNKNPSQHYCQFVIQPEVEKFKKVFKDKIKQ